MAEASDSDYKPSESEGSSDDDKDSYLKFNKSNKRSNTPVDLDVGYSLSEGNTRKRAKLLQYKTNDNYLLNGRGNKKKNCIIRSDGIAHIYQCSFCYYQTPFRYNLKTHFKQCKKSEAKKFWRCPHCNGKYTIEDLLDEHSIPDDLEEVDENVFHCPDCSVHTVGKSQVFELEQFHQGSCLPQRCPCCSLRIVGTYHLKQHLINDHDIPIHYRCEYCDFFYLELHKLRKHKKVHKEMQEMGLIKCSHCQMEFFTLKDVKDHMKSLNKKVWMEDVKKESKNSSEDVEGLMKRLSYKIEDKAEQIEKKESKNMEKQRKKNSVESFELSEDSDNGEINVCSVDNNLSYRLGNLQLKCTLCGYENYSITSCQRHAKNKHRPFGYEVVMFDKYCGEQFMGTFSFGKIKDDPAPKQTATEKLLKVLDWTQSDDENATEENEDTAEKNEEIITIELTADSEEELDKNENNLGDNNKMTFLWENIDENREKLSQDEKVPTSQKSSFECEDCTYHTNNEAFLTIHNMLYHNILGEGSVYKCPLKHCTYSKNEKNGLKIHLGKRHKLKDLTVFYPKDLKCPYCRYVAKLPHYLILHRIRSHPNQRGKGSSKNGKPYKCTRCDFATSYSHNYQRHLTSVHKMGTTSKTQQSIKRNSSRFGCQVCGKQCKGNYQFAWHRFASHGDRFPLRKWQLKCKICNYTNYSKLGCYKHGLLHKRTRVIFAKYYMGNLKGAITLRYKSAKTTHLKELESVFHHNVVETGKNKKLEKDRTNLDKETNVANVIGSVESRDDELNETQESKSDDDNLLEKKAEFYYCQLCSYETKTQWQFQLHRFTTHAPYKSSDDAKFKCRDCEFETNYRYNFRRHIEHIHNYSEQAYFKVHYKSKIKEENTDGRIINKKKLDRNKNKHDNIDMKEVEYEFSGSLDCPVCYRNYSDKYQLAWHLFKVHRDDSKILKWILKCTLCNYKTYSRKNAYTHGTIHRGVEETTVKFKKYYAGVLKGSLKLKYGKGHVFKCSKCDYVTNTWDNFRKHETDNHFWKRKIRMGSEIISNDNENSDEKEQNEYIKSEVDSDNEEEINQNEDDIHENESHYNNDNENYYNEDEVNDNEYQYNKDDVNDNENCYNEDRVNDNEHYYKEDDVYDNENHSQDVMLIPNNCMNPDCQYRTGNMSHLKRHCLDVHKYEKEKVDDYFSQLKVFKCRKCGIETRYRKELRDHLKRCKKRNHDECNKEYTKDQIIDIIGCNTVQIKEKEKCTEENVEEVEDVLKNQETKEVITIQIIPDQKINATNEDDEDQSNLNPFTVKLTMARGDTHQLGDSGATRKSSKSNFRCNRVGCKFACETLKEVTNHIKSCTHENINKNINRNTKFTCHLCKEVLNNRNNLQTHCNTHADTQNNPELIVTFSEVTNDRHKCDVEIKADLDARKERGSARNVEEARNVIPEVKKKVSYKCWMCGVLIFTRSTLWSHTNLHAREDGNLKLKVRYSKFLGDKSENTLIVQADPNYVFRKKNTGPERSPDLGYDPNLLVFGCEECNFKTNQEGALKKHKSLHWTPEKEVLFKAGKFFTCSICFFHCFDVETFKQHGEWHKTHYTSTGSIRKLGKNSWFLK